MGLAGNRFHSKGKGSGSGASFPDKYDLITCGINVNMALLREQGVCMCANCKWHPLRLLIIQLLVEDSAHRIYCMSVFH